MVKGRSTIRHMHMGLTGKEGPLQQSAYGPHWWAVSLQESNYMPPYLLKSYTACFMMQEPEATLERPAI